MRRLEAQWQVFRAVVIHRQASPTQVEEMRRSFYAGASALFDVVMGMLSPGTEATPADLVKMDELHQELTDHLEAEKQRCADILARKTET